MPPKPMMMEDVEGEEDDQMISATWEMDDTGTLRHKATNLRVSGSGIATEGHEYRLSPGDIVMEEHQLGAGAGGVVKRGVIRQTGQEVAVKSVKIDDKAKRAQLLNEIRGLVCAEGSDYLVQWYAGFVVKATNTVNVALEYMDLGSLRDLHKRTPDGMVPPPFLACINFQIMKGLQHLHYKKLLHRDIKPENILHNTAGQVKLTDFGIAKDLDATLAMANTFIGTGIYMSPERCLGTEYNFASDIWSVGMVLHELATGKYPFTDCKTFPALFANLVDKPEPRLDAAQFPPALVDFAANCLVRDVAKRADTEMLLEHPFVTEGVPSQQELATFLQSLA